MINSMHNPFSPISLAADLVSLKLILDRDAAIRNANNRAAAAAVARNRLARAQATGRRLDALLAQARMYASGK